MTPQKRVEDPGGKSILFVPIVAGTTYKTLGHNHEVINRLKTTQSPECR